MTNFYQSNLQWVGIAKETTYGTAVAAPTLWIPVDSPVRKHIITPLKDQALRGSMATTYEQQQGLIHDELTYKTYLYSDTVYPHFLAILGNPDDVSGPTDGEYAHATSLYNGDGTNSAQPASYTLFYYDASGTVFQIAGAIPADVKITLGAEALATLDVTWIGLPGVAIEPPTNTPSDVKPVPSWSSAITLGGTALAQYSSIELDFKRATEIIPTITGTQSPFAVFGGPFSLTGSLTGVYQNVADLNWVAYLSNSQPALSVVLTDPSTAKQLLVIDSERVAYDNVDVSGTNKWQEIKATTEALANASNSVGAGLSPVTVVFYNTSATPF
jgi:hypothetical protein